jgi:hypothetical protein
MTVLCIGFDPQVEREDADRTFELEPRSEWQIHETAKVTDKLAVVITAGGGVDMLPWINKTKAVICSWYAGQEGQIALDAGETKTVSVHLPPESFKFYNPQIHEWVLEPGKFEILVGASSADIRQRGFVNA